MNIIEVIKPGLFTSIQFPGTAEMIEFGIPIGGPMDQIAATKACALLGVSPECGLLEFTMSGAELQILEPLRFVLSGAEMNATLNDLSIELDTVYETNSGDILKLGSCSQGMRTYLAMDRKIGNPKGLISKRLVKGDLIKATELEEVLTSTDQLDSYPDQLLVHSAPESDILSDQQIDQLNNMVYTLSPSSNRMASVLDHEPISAEFDEMISSPILPGTIQLLPSGKIIILMRDCQTMGGYPRIGILGNEAISRLSQIRPGEQVHLVFMR